MKWKQIKWRIAYALQYFPFTLNTLLVTGAVWWAWYLLYTPPAKGETPSMLMPFVLLLGKMTLLVFMGFIGVSVLSTLICWVHYLLIRGSQGIIMKVDFTTESRQGKRNKLFLNATLDAAFRPFLGFVKGRLYYDDNIFTDRFALLSNKKGNNGNWRVAIAGRSQMVLPDIKEYDLKGGFVYFQDMLHLFSLAVSQPITGHFHQPPVLLEGDDADVYPKKTETQDIRIEQLRRVDGEYLNYKDFESGDDVRRIVWKVYARNRELVIRVPEMFEPFASHLYYYASFSTPNAQWLHEGFLKEMLNYYKNSVWTVYDTLSKKEWQMRYIPDQAFNIPENLGEGEKTAHIISNSQWHAGKPLQQYFNAKHGTVLCISSLTDTNELSSTLEQCDAATVVYFVKLSNTFRHFAPLNLLGRILFRPPQDRLARMRTRWTFSAFRLKVARQEKEIEALLNKSAVTWGAL